ncbi:GNAT family N-acetyltransferase [Streptomyces sp. SAJ15]|uniref:GNAT family N-acetyltransferase n=1 Tax=Streptomyces sp. SAJ15 TaxID=2011095 RepID=UPI001185E5B3|nr:GNAT family N-acetyltransferase [Streptomyces sp. SAJ15]TVL89684.1 GNAT family N-acetyltransferase [Streptomyces sp. SAJ15]
MIPIRAALPADAAELVRLRRLMFAEMNGRDEPGTWERSAREIAFRQLSEDGPCLGGFVVEGDPRDGGAHLAACAIGRVEQRLPAPGHPTGRFAFVFTVCTDPRYRGHGYARATTRALLDWFAGHGVTRVDLHASEESERLYRSLGFAEHSIALSLDLTRRGLKQAG